jgi:glycine/D-amino acid oxidase-like deaminating enzyme
VEYDAIIVGAGVLGLSTAYHIKNLCPNDKILVVDKLGAAGQGNTAKSAAMFRSFFYSHTNLTLADTSIDFYKHLQEDLGVNLKIKWPGYLWLFSEQEYRRLEPALKKLDGRGLKHKVYEKEELTKRFKLNTDVATEEDSKRIGLVDVDKGVFVPKAGSLDVDNLVNFYESEFTKLGGETQYNTKVKEILTEARDPLGIPGEPYFWQESRVAGVNTNKKKINAKKTVIAAGAWTPFLLDQVGINSHVKARKRQIFSVKADTKELKELLWTEGFNHEGCIPFTILPKPRVYLKPALEEDAFWFCYGDEFPREFKMEEDPKTEENFYQFGIYQVVVKYLPQFVGKQPFTSFAGQYAVNTIDGQPVIFEENDLMVVGGASGSGIMKADAIGRVAASLYAEKEYATLFGGKQFKVSELGMTERKVEPEKLVI